MCKIKRFFLQWVGAWNIFCYFFFVFGMGRCVHMFFLEGGVNVDCEVGVVGLCLGRVYEWLVTSELNVVREDCGVDLMGGVLSLLLCLALNLWWGLCLKLVPFWARFEHNRWNLQYLQFLPGAKFWVTPLSQISGCCQWKLLATGVWDGILIWMGT